MKKRRRRWGYIRPINKPPKKLGVVIAFDIETRQVDVNEQISGYKIKVKSEIIFGTACAYAYEPLAAKKGDTVINSRLGFQPRVKSYILIDELFFETAQKFTEWILKIVNKYKRITIYAHNLSFDLRESVDFEMLRKAGFEITIFNPMSKQFIIRFVKGKNKNRQKIITFTDTLNLYPASLEEVGDTIGLSKLEKELGLNRADLESAIKEGRWEDVLAYNVRDTQITANAVIIREEVVNQLGGELRLTNPSTAMDVFRRRFMKYDIKKPSKRTLKYIRAAYFGGRTEVFFRGVVARKNYAETARKLQELKKNYYEDYGFLVTDEIHYVDVNSLYPYSMWVAPTPVSELGIYAGDDGVKRIKALYKLGLIIEMNPLKPYQGIYEAWKKQLVWLRNQRPEIDWDSVEKAIERHKHSKKLLKYRHYFAKPVVYLLEATVHVAKKPITRMVTPLPIRKDGKLIFPQGTFRGFWTQYELSIFNPPKDTRIIDIHSVILFKADWLFIEYIDTFYKLKSDAKRHGDTVMYQVAKLFMNSLYGKWAEHKRVSVMMSKEEFSRFLFEKLIDNWKNVSIELAYDLDYGVINVDSTRITAIGGYYEVKTKEYMEPYNAAISTFITSFARSVLREYMYMVKEAGGQVFYCDTDSLIVDGAGFEALKDFIDAYMLGYLDEEIPNIAFLEINTLKDYKVFVPKPRPDSVLDEQRIGYVWKLITKAKQKEKIEYFYFDEKDSFWVKYKLKGVSLKKAKVRSDENDDRFAVERLVGVREFLKYRKFGLYWIEQEKELKRNYDKAESADGWIIPYCLNTTNSP